MASDLAMLVGHLATKAGDALGGALGEIGVAADVVVLVRPTDSEGCCVASNCLEDGAGSVQKVLEAAYTTVMERPADMSGESVRRVR